MSSPWIETKIEEMGQKGGAKEELASRLATARLRGNLRKDLVVVKNIGEGDRSVVNSLNQVGIDRVKLVHVELSGNE